MDRRTHGARELALAEHMEPERIVSGDAASRDLDHEQGILLGDQAMRIEHVDAIGLEPCRGRHPIGTELMLSVDACGDRVNLDPGTS